MAKRFEIRFTNVLMGQYRQVVHSTDTYQEALEWITRSDITSSGWDPRGEEAGEQIRDRFYEIVDTAPEKDK